MEYEAFTLYVSRDSDFSVCSDLKASLAAIISADFIELP